MTFQSNMTINTSTFRTVWYNWVFPFAKKNMSFQLLWGKLDANVSNKPDIFWISCYKWSAYSHHLTQVGHIATVCIIFDQVLIA